MDLAEFIESIGIITIRILTIFPLVLWVTLFMGRRTTGQMPVFDFLIVLSLGSVVGADIAEPEIHHLPTAYAIICIGLLQKLFSYCAIRFRWFGNLVTMDPVIVIYQGKIVQEHLRSTRYTLNNLLHLLREQQIFDVSTVQLAILESGGNLSIMEQPDTPISYPVIKEGDVDPSILYFFQLDEDWLLSELTKQQVLLTDVFFATVNPQHELHVTKYTEAVHQLLPPIQH